MKRRRAEVSVKYGHFFIYMKRKQFIWTLRCGYIRYFECKQSQTCECTSDDSAKPSQCIIHMHSLSHTIVPSLLLHLFSVDADSDFIFVIFFNSFFVVVVISNSFSFHFILFLFPLIRFVGLMAFFSSLSLSVQILCF